MYLTERVLSVLDLSRFPFPAYTSAMSALYPASAEWHRLYVGAAGLCAGLTVASLEWSWPLAPLAIAGFAYTCHRATLFAQEIELTQMGVICRSRFGEMRLPYRQIGAMRFCRLNGDLLLERPQGRVRIPRHFRGEDEIRRAVSLAVWAHRGGEVPPDLAEPDSAFG